MEAFGRVRTECPALRVLITDDEWPRFEEWHRSPDLLAYHASAAFIAFRRGHLARVTAPIHALLLTASGQLKPAVRKQYLEDLQERWMYGPTALDRHRQFRRFMGRLVELQVAEWLRDQGWALTGLEALRPGTDIEATGPAGRAHAFEIKFIGAEDADFSQVVEALTGASPAGSVSPYAAANYLLLRAFEAARQLGAAPDVRVCLVVVDSAAWWRFDCVVTNDWIDWSAPAFLEADENWATFLEGQIKKYPTLLIDLEQHIRSLNAIWLLRRDSGYEYKQMRQFVLRGA